MVDKSDITMDKLKQFLVSKAKSWQIDPELIDRCMISTNQVIEHIREAKLHTSNIGLQVTYD